MKRWLKILIGIVTTLVVLLVIAYLGMGYVIYNKLADVRGTCDEWTANTPDHFALHPAWPSNFDVTQYYMSPYEAVRFPSRAAGIEIAGWWLEKDPNAPAIIMVHGLGGCKGAIEVLAPAGMLWRNGYNVLLLDIRDVGDSTYEDGRSAIGNEEYLDVLGAWDWLVQEKGFEPARIGLFANSLGGATALYAFSEEPRVAALFLQSTFGNLTQVLQGELERAGYPAILAPGAIIAGRIVAGDNLVAHDPISAICKCGNRPVFVVHSKADTRISYHQAEQLVAAARAAGINAQLWLVDEGEHVQTPAVYPQEFEQRMVGFFEETLTTR